MRLFPRSVTRRARIASTVAVAVVVSGSLVAASAFGAQTKGAARESVTRVGDIQLIGVEETAASLKGIPQAGAWLGTDKAPIQMVVFADLQCPFCKQFDTEVNPTVIKEFIKPGKVRLFFSGMDFIGKDSTRGLKAAAAAANQNKLWNLVTLLYKNQGTERTGWLSDKMVDAVAKSIPGLDYKKFKSDLKSASVDKRMKEWAALSTSAGVTSTPTFFAGTKGKLGSLAVTALDPAQFRSALTKLVNAK